MAQKVVKIAYFYLNIYMISFSITANDTIQMKSFFSPFVSY